MVEITSGGMAIAADWWREHVKTKTPVLTRQGVDRRLWELIHTPEAWVGMFLPDTLAVLHDLMRERRRLRAQ